MSQNKKLVSIVVPCYNEAGNVPDTIKELTTTLTPTQYDFEIIMVNDGSKDGTWEKIKEQAKLHPEVRGVNLMRNYGMTQAYMAGFDLAKGDYVITVSGDLEIPAHNLVKVLEYLEQGYDFVNTHRKGRWAKASRSLPSKVANAMISRISGSKIVDTGSGMKGFSRVIIDNLRMYGEMHRFIPSYLTDFGAKMIEFDVEYQERKYGKSSYGSLSRTLKVMLDMITMAFMTRLNRKPFYAMPGRLFGFTGAVIFGLGTLGSLYLLFLKIMGESIGSRPLFFVSIMMVILGLQSMMMGMIGELVMRTYYESSGRKNYTIRETVN